ncbi:MAG: heavy-metal-associated domain-containing protein [Lachnospiraceae bacterium]|nr:heavy-metal-associated domain-containing protein [Lachnospiraceae bacterium]
MYKTTAKVEGMMCGMCEAHVQDAVRNAFDDAKKVKASHKKNELTFQTKEAPDTEKLKKLITDTGYTFVSAETIED